MKCNVSVQKQMSKCFCGFTPSLTIRWANQRTKVELNLSLSLEKTRLLRDTFEGCCTTLDDCRRKMLHFFKLWYKAREMAADTLFSWLPILWCLSERLAFLHQLPSEGSSGKSAWMIKGNLALADVPVTFSTWNCCADQNHPWMTWILNFCFDGELKFVTSSAPSTASCGTFPSH